MQPYFSRPLENLEREELLTTTRNLLAEADALSSRISVLNEIGLAVNQSLDLARIERVIARQAKWLLDFEHCSVCLFEGDHWGIKTLFGRPEPAIADLETMPNLAGAFDSTRPVLLNEGMPSRFLAEYQSQIIIPLNADNRFVGTINFATTAPGQYSRDDMRIGLMLALHLASAIRNARIVADLKATREELRLRLEELDAYGHTIAHDLKSPLTNVLLRAQLIKMSFPDHTLPDQAAHMLDSIEQSTKVMARMIDQLLLLARLRHDEVAFVPVDAHHMAESALQRFSHQIEAKPVQVTVMPDMPTAFGQPQWVEEIFANLISNAIKYMGAKNAAPAISIGGHPQGRFVRYEVRDNGIGIRPEDRDKLFRMFSRASAPAGVEGIGLGLSIAHRIIRKLHGEIGVDSEYGAGSCFWFTLPAVDPTLPQTASRLG